MFYDEWHPLTHANQLSEIENLSHKSPVFIFKHSTRCGISASAEHNLANDWKATENRPPLFHLDLIRHRDLSNVIADRYGVVHQSPQVIVLSDGKVVDHTSHHMINSEYINKVLKTSSTQS